MATEDLPKYQNGISWEDILGNNVGQVTSRDQIINPTKYVNPSFYSNTRKGRAQYESDLAAAKYFAEQQEAAYQDWFNSTQQQVQRDRLAGLNPDLNGLSDSSPASDTNPVEVSPMQGLPTNGQLALEGLQVGFGALSSIASVFNTVSSIMGTVSNVRLNKAYEDRIRNENESLFLSNIDSFMSLASSRISDLLAQKISSSEGDFDISAFFSQDFSDLKKSILPSDDPRYHESFDNVLHNSQKTLSDAYSQLATSEEGRKKFLTHLSSGYYSRDDDEMVGQLKIIVQAKENLDLVMTSTQTNIQNAINTFLDNLDIEAIASSMNEEASFNADYFSALEGEMMAIYEQAYKEALSIQEGAQASVYGYLNEQFTSSKSPNRKSRLGWTILSGASMGWQDFMTASTSAGFSLMKRSVQEHIRTEVSQRSRNYKEGKAALINASVNRKNAITNRMNAFTNSKNANTNRLNAESNRIKAEAAAGTAVAQLINAETNEGRLELEKNVSTWEVISNGLSTLVDAVIPG